MQLRGIDSILGVVGQFRLNVWESALGWSACESIILEDSHLIPFLVDCAVHFVSSGSE